ncbi:MAG: glycoside hydrolase family 38 C-terminal domain-containing protein, partial [Ignavibacteriaceae bacterium]
FDVYINNYKRFLIKSGTSDNWEISDENGGKLKYFGMKKEPWGESQGYMALWAPKSWIIPGKPLIIKIVGHAEDSQCWVIVYKANDANSYLQNSVKYNSWADIIIKKENEKSLINVNVPLSLAGKDLTLNIGSKIYDLKISALNDKGTGSLSVDTKFLKETPFILKDDYDELLSVDSISAEGEFIKLSFKSLIKNSIKKNNENETEISSTRSYYPKTVEALVKLSESKLSSGKIFLMNSSHQDIAWMDSPEKCIIERDTMLLTPLFNKALKEPGYRFDIEDALMLREYIHRHPESRDKIKRLLLNGQISCGAFYTQPYEDMYSGEALVRQLYLGAMWLKNEFGYKADTYWNEDVPVRTLQMPQILSKAGIKYMAISRIRAGVYNWYSPDSSYVTTYSPGHYGYAYSALHNGFGEAARFIADTSLWWDKYYNTDSKSKYIPLFSDNDMSPAEDYSGIINNWNKITEVQKTLGKYSGLKLPKIEMSLTSDFIKKFEENGNLLPSIEGERPDVWLYIHGPTHHKAVQASREGDILLTAAEKFAAADAMINNSFAKYPSKKLEKAWEAKIYPDHGWGGKNGDITDGIFHDKFIYAKNQAVKILSATLNDIASKIKLSNDKGIPVVVFNSLSWLRDDPAEFNIKLKKGEAKSLKLIDSKGNAIPIQLSNVKLYKDNSIDEADIHFIAEGIPSIGYKTFYLKVSKDLVSEEKEVFKNLYENKFYRVRFKNGGLSSIYDKELGKELINNKSFNAGEVFTLHSEGTGAGEFADIQQPDMKNFDREANYSSNWKLSESGEVYTCFENRQPIRNAVVEQKIFIYKNIKRIDFVINLLNYEGVLYREFRMALPLNMKNGQVSYEVPFGVVNVGKDEIKGSAGERYTSICKDTHPRSIENWIGADDNEFGVTLTSSVAVADYIDPTDSLDKNTLLQPLLLASRRSCHWQGNEYLQTGDHHFEFSLTSH